MECGSAAECLGTLVGKNCFYGEKYCHFEEMDLMSGSVVDDTGLLNQCSEEDSQMAVYVMPMVAGQVFEATLRGV